MKDYSLPIRGIFPAMITPLTEDERVNLPVLRQLVDFLIDSGVHGLFALGSQGEFYALNPAEKQQVIETVVDQAAGRVPVYIGAGAVTTAEAVAMAEVAEQVGADAVSVITPYFITPSPEELYRHFAAVAKATRLPVLLYANPSRTNVNLPIDLVIRLSEIENIVGIKDSSGDFTMTCEYIRRTPPGFNVIAGRDTLILPTLLFGGSGGISATANVVPGLVTSIYELFCAGDVEGAKRAQQTLAPLRLAFELGTFPNVIKAAMSMIGIPAGPARAPVGPLNEESIQTLQTILQDLKVL